MEEKQWPQFIIANTFIAHATKMSEDESIIER